MKLLVDLFEVSISDVGVDLSSSNTAMAEHALDAADIRAIHQQVSGKTVSHSVWADMLCDAG